MAPFIHKTADVQATDIGEGTRIWQFCVILPGAKIGRNCNICACCFIENDVVIGDNVTVKPFTGICDGVTLEDDVFIGPNVSFTNDRHPKSGNRGFKQERTVICKGASIGAGTMVMSGLTIGEGALAAAGSVVTHDIPPGVTVCGVPVRPMPEKEKPE